MLEMLLVLLMVGMLSLSGGFAWQHYRQHARLSQAGHQIADFLSRLQWRANCANQRCRVSVTPGIGGTLSGNCGVHPGESSGLCPPLSDIRLDISEPGYITFRGWHNTATPAHLSVSNPAGRIRIIISGTGRLRLCSEKGRWAGVPPC